MNINRMIIIWQTCKLFINWKRFFFLIYYLSFKIYVKTKIVSPNEDCVPSPKKSKPKKGLSFLLTELYHLTGKCVFKKTQCPDDTCTVHVCSNIHFEKTSNCTPKLKNRFLIFFYLTWKYVNMYVNHIFNSVLGNWRPGRLLRQYMELSII